MPRNKPKFASLSLNLDGCRFGDSPPPHRSNNKSSSKHQQQQHQHSSSSSSSMQNSNIHKSREEQSEENRHPNQPNIEQQQRHQHQQQHDDDPLSNHYRNHQPQYTTLPPSHHGNNCNSNNDGNTNNNDHLPPSPMGNTYRAEGLSIGRNFLRFEGSTLSSKLSVRDLDVVECVGRGVCSSVWKARRRRNEVDADGTTTMTTMPPSTTSSLAAERGGTTTTTTTTTTATTATTTTAEGEGTTEYYALKLFPLRDPARRSMLVRELKLLCAFHCDCLVELEGAFIDYDDEDGNGNGGGGGGSGDCTVTLVLEFMDRGSLSDLTVGRGGAVPSPSPGLLGNNGPGENAVGGHHRDDPTAPGNDRRREGHFTVPTITTTPRISSPLFRGLSPPTAEKHGKVPEYAIAAIAYQMLWGLGFLHFEGVLHRDIKPANILVSSAGRVKLADFGIVSQRHPPSTTTTTTTTTTADAMDGSIMSPMNHTVVGTTRYMSPERLRGKPYAKSSDVWSLGLVLLEIARGDSPFEDITSVIELVQTLDECKMSEFIPETTSHGLREILLGCLDHSPQNRMPATILLSSPWFQSHDISDVDDASKLMKTYLDRAYPPLSNGT